MKKITFFLIFSLITAGCATTKSMKLGANHYPPKPDNCEIEILTQAPQKKFEEVCMLTSRGGQSLFESKNVEGLIPGLKKEACACGADAIILKHAQEGGYNFSGAADRASANATAVKYSDLSPVTDTKLNPNKNNESNFSSETVVSEKKFSIGLLGGFSYINYGVGSKFEWGINETYKISSNLGIGVSILNINLSNGSQELDDTELGAGTYYLYKESIDWTFYNLNINYYLNNFWFGVQVGLVKNSFSQDEGLDYGLVLTQNAFDFGPVLGYNFNLIPEISVGIEASFLLVPSRKYNSFSTLGSLRFNL